MQRSLRGGYILYGTNDPFILPAVHPAVNLRAGGGPENQTSRRFFSEPCRRRNRSEAKKRSACFSAMCSMKWFESTIKTISTSSSGISTKSMAGGQR